MNTLPFIVYFHFFHFYVRFSGQDRLSTALWFISGAEISVRLDKDLKFVDDDSLIWDFFDFLHELRCDFWNLGFPQFTPQDWLLFSRN